VLCAEFELFKVQDALCLLRSPVMQTVFKINDNIYFSGAIALYYLFAQQKVSIFQDLV